MGIQYLTYQQINQQKWDECISNASNGLIYGYSVYLDTMADSWDALVLNDYDAVMPLTWRRKYGIRYLYQPFFTASLGVFGNNLSATLLNDFLQAIPANFKYWNIYLNAGNYFELPAFKLYERANYVLPLQNNYQQLFQQFRNNIKRNIVKAKNLQLLVQKNIPVDNVIELAKEQSTSFSSVSDNDYERFKKLYHHFYINKQAATYGVFTPQKQLVASCVFFFSHKRAYYILAGNHPNGKTLGASHALIAAFIEEYAAQDMLLDFEGSDISSLAFFYSSFGAATEKYVGLKNNKLPGLLKLFKK